MKNIYLKIDYQGREHACELDPIESTVKEGVPRAFSVSLDGKYLGVIQCAREGWIMDRQKNQSLWRLWPIISILGLSKYKSLRRE